MTMVEARQDEQLTPGASFTHSSGRAVLISPTDPAERLWLCWNPANGALEEIVVGAVTWDSDPLPLPEILGGLARGWSQLQGDHERTQVVLARTEEKIGQMREYAVSKHVAGHICRVGLDEALAHFDLAPYRPRYRVRVKVTEVFELDADSAERAYNRARYLTDGIAFSGANEEDDLEIVEEATQVEVEGIVDK